MHADYLEHHGIIGQKWGIRRYQNFDGTYTKAGLDRYKKSSEKYETKKAEYKSIKKSDESRYNKKMARAKMLEAERQMKKDYKHLKNDKLADKGKVRYKSGERIRENERVVRSLATIGSFSISAAMYYSRKNEYDKRVTNALYKIAGMSLLSAGTIAAIDSRPNRELREYYSHTSKY